VIGLGNPGNDYADTRHNAGFLVVDDVAETWSITIHQKKFNVEFGRGRIKGIDTILVKPQAYMNKSGPPVRQVSDYFKISYRDMLVVHDDIDLEFGRLKIKEKGGHGGHNGVRSLIDAWAKMRLSVFAWVSGVPGTRVMWSTMFWAGLAGRKKRPWKRLSIGPGMLWKRSFVKVQRKA